MFRLCDEMDITTFFGTVIGGTPRTIVGLVAPVVAEALAGRHLDTRPTRLTTS